MRYVHFALPISNSLHTGAFPGKIGGRESAGGENHPCILIKVVILIRGDRPIHPW